MGSSGVPIIGGMLNAYGAEAEAEDKSSALSAEARTQEKNAEIAREAGRYNAAKQQIAAGKKFGEMQAGYAASGVAQDSGSILDVLRESHVNAELDRQNILYGAEMKYNNAKARAQAASNAAFSTERAGHLNAFSALIGGAGKAYSPGNGKRSGVETSDYGSAGNDNQDFSNYA